MNGFAYLSLIGFLGGALVAAIGLGYYAFLCFKEDNNPKKQKNTNENG